jgi:signal transduction histidine kinase
MRADRGDLEMILNNLVSNAVKYNREGGQVGVAVEGQDGTVRVAVADTGIGMSAQEAAQLFREFSRIKNPQTRNILGSGLGLSIVKKVAALYGGEVQVQSETGVGSTFRVILHPPEPGGEPARGAAPPVPQVS